MDSRGNGLIRRVCECIGPRGHLILRGASTVVWRSLETLGLDAEVQLEIKPDREPDERVLHDLRLIGAYVDL